jgi:hypothetical protein
MSLVPSPRAVLHILLCARLQRVCVLLSMKHAHHYVVGNVQSGSWSVRYRTYHLSDFAIHRQRTYFFAGVPGFEPGSGGSKGRCLTTWLHPNRWDISHSNKKRPTHIELAYKYIEKSKVSQSEIHFSCIDFRYTFLYFNHSLFWRKDADNAK